MKRIYQEDKKTTAVNVQGGWEVPSRRYQRNMHGIVGRKQLDK